MENIFYHGSNSLFEKFSFKDKKTNTLESEGFYFTNKKEVAETYGNILYEVELDLKDSLVIDFEEKGTCVFNGKFYTPSQISLKVKEINSDLENSYSLDDDLIDELKYFGWDINCSDKINSITMLNINDNNTFLSKSTSINYVVFEENQINIKSVVNLKHESHLSSLVEDFENKTQDNKDSNSSCVKNDDGSPKVFYHGTNADFETFDTEKAKDGWFGKSFCFIEDRKKAKEFGKKLMVVNLNIKNPYIPESVSPSGLYSEVVDKFKPDIKIGHNADIGAVLKDNGYDGIVYKHWDEEVGTYYAVFDAEQIEVVDKIEHKSRQRRS